MVNPKVVHLSIYLSLSTKTDDCPHGIFQSNSPTGICISLYILYIHGILSGRCNVVNPKRVTIPEVYEIGHAI